jgi:uncharacterized membrane protein YeaQ/YmgE (transglycosylase-associated protein family)
LTVFISIFNSVWNILLLLAVAALCGMIAQAVAHHHRGGCLASIGIGFLGDVPGIWVAGIVHLPKMFRSMWVGPAFPSSMPCSEARSCS